MKKNKGLTILITLLVLFSLVSMIIVKGVYDRQFPQYPRHDETITAQLRYADIEDEYPRERVSFMSGKNQLQGYLYGQDHDRGLIVLSHGIGGGADSYLPQIRYFASQGWQVFAYDATGSFDSEGESTRGFPQAILDLDAALRYVESESRLADLPLLLFGHSWGGYASANILHFEHDIQGVITVSAANSAMEMIMEQGRRMMGGWITIQKPYLWLYQKMLFPDTVSLRGDEAIRRSDVPVMIVHGTEDEMISFTGSSIISHRESLQEVPVQILIMDQPGRNGHNSLFRSESALEYLNELNAQYRELYDRYDENIPYEIKQEFYAGVDRNRGDLDPDMMAAMHDFYLECLGPSD